MGAVDETVRNLTTHGDMDPAALRATIMADVDWLGEYYVW